MFTTQHLKDEAVELAASGDARKIAAALMRARADGLHSAGREIEATQLTIEATAYAANGY